MPRYDYQASHPQSDNGDSGRDPPPADFPYPALPDDLPSRHHRGRPRQQAANLGPTSFIYDESRFLLAAVDLPIVRLTAWSVAAPPKFFGGKRYCTHDQQLGLSNKLGVFSDALRFCRQRWRTTAKVEQQMATRVLFSRPCITLAPAPTQDIGGKGQSLSLH